MNVKYFNVYIVITNMQLRGISRDTFKQYMKLPHINVNIVSRNTHIRVISINI